MRKLFYVLGLLAAMSLTAFSSGSNEQKPIESLPQEMQEFAYDLRSMIIYKLDSKETRFKDIVVDGNNLVCRFIFNEEETGISLKEGFNRNMTEEDIRDEFIRRINKKCESTKEALRTYKYNVVARFTGSKSKHVRDVKISYKEF